MSDDQDVTIETPREIAEIKRQPLVVQDDTSFLFDTARFEQIQRLSALMAACRTMPEHLRGSMSDCFRVASQAFRWNLDPFAIADKTYFVSGKLAYEGQLIAAVINSRSGIEGRLRYEYSGSAAKTDTLSVKVIGKFPDEDFERDVSVDWKSGFAMSKGARDKWISQPEQQLSYFAARVWARRHCPEVILGAYTPEELWEESKGMKDVTPKSGSKLDQLEAAIRDRKEVVSLSSDDAQETS